MENTLHLLAGDETNANKTDRQSSASSYYNYGVYGKFSDNSNDIAGQMQNVYEEGTYTTNNASVSVDGFALRLQGKKIHQSDSKRSKYKFIDNDPNIHVKFKEGTVIAGRYEILGPIDHGKFGHVFQCRDKKRKNKIVAAKISGD